MNIAERKKISWIDAGKGVGIFFVVLGHTITPTLRESSAIWMFMYYLIYFFHTRLLFFLSGYIFNIKLRDYRKKGFLNLVCKKAKRLLLPYFLILALTFFFINIIYIFPILAKALNKANLPSMDFSLWITGVLEGNNFYNLHLWYVYVLFIVMVVYYIMATKLKREYILLFFCLMFLYQHFKVNNDSFYVLNRTFDYGVYFALGCSYKIAELNFKHKMFYIISLAYLFIFAFAKAYELDTLLFNPIFVLVFSYGIITFIIRTLIAFQDKNLKFLSCLGKRSFPIYLFHHPFFTSGFMAIFLNINSNLGLLFCILTTILSIFLSLFVESLLKFKIFNKIRPYLLGQ